MTVTRKRSPAVKTERRWFQYSLRTLLLLVFLCAVGGSWLGTRAERVRRQREAVRAIERSGGNVWYDYQADQCEDLLLEGKPFSNRWARWLLGDENLFTRVVTASPKTDAGCERLGDLIGLRAVWISSPMVTDAGLAHLKKLTGLRELALERTAVTDAGLAHLRALTQLEELSLHDTRITDAGLRHLEGLHRLRVLDCAGTRVTFRGRERLRAARPDLITRQDHGQWD